MSIQFNKVTNEARAFAQEVFVDNRPRYKNPREWAHLWVDLWVSLFSMSYTLGHIAGILVPLLIAYELAN